MEALRQSLRHNPGILLQSRQVELRHGEFEAAGGPFDPTLRGAIGRSDDHLPLTEEDARLAGASDLLTRTTSYRVSLDRQLRSGTILSPGIEMTRIDQSLGQDDPANRAEVSFQIIQPLFRGRGTSSAVATNENASGMEYEATRHDLTFTVNRTVLETISAYWDYRTAWESLKILRESEAAAARLVEEIQTLVASDERPRSDLGQVEANLSDRAAARINAEQALFQAGQVLGLTMGISFEEISDLGIALTPFPAPVDENALDPGKADRFIELARNRRADLKASRIREDAAGRFLAGAKNNMLPRIDLELELGYAGLDEGDGIGRLQTPFFQNTRGVNAGVQLTASLPLYNKEAGGIFRQRKALREQQKILTADLSRQIASNVAVAVSALRTGALELEKSERAVRYYRDSIEDEKTKLLLGMSTVLDLISLQDRLTNALLSNVLQHAGYARSLASLRFETGTLIESEDGDYSVRLERLTRVP